MPNKTISGIRNYLNTQLSTLLPSGSDKLQDLKQGHSVAFAGYPAARFFYVSTREILADQKDKWRSHTFKIELVYRLTGEDKSVAEGVLEDAMEAVMNAIDTDFTFNGNADNSELSADMVREVDGPAGVTLVLPLTVTAQILLFF